MLDAFNDRRYLIPFRSQLLPHIFTDTLVIGGGVAGMRAAIEAAEEHDGERDVILLVKGALDLSSTAWAQGGLAASWGDGDTTDAHYEDTIRAGAGLCDAEAVRTLVDDAGPAIEELIGWGMRFDRNTEGELDLGREGGHTHHRILHTDGASTGRELVRCLSSQLRSSPSLRVFDRCFAIDLLTGDGPDGRPRVLGAITHHPKHGLQIVWARATVLATGGAGQVFRETTNPKVTTGDGLAMAFRAGATIGDVEMIQFHPTTLYVAGAGRLLISEAVRGEGAHLVDRAGVRFMPAFHEQAELAPRDVVSRAIVEHLHRTREAAVYLDLRPIGGERFEQRFPGLAREIRAFDLDPGRDLIPVHPSAHYTLGGVWIDLEGRTSVPGLFACGEASCMGLHGANRLASNSLLEGLVYGRRAGRAAADEITSQAPPAPRPIVSDIPIHEHADLDLADVASSLRSAMWRNVGIERTGAKLDDVLDLVNFWGRYTMDMIFDDPAGWEIQNMLTVGALVTAGARWREETRGVHVRLDHPATDDDRRVHAIWRRGDLVPERRPVRDAASDVPPAPDVEAAPTR